MFLLKRMFSLSGACPNIVLEYFKLGCQSTHKSHMLTEPNYYTSAVSNVSNYLHARGHNGNQVAVITPFGRALRIYLLYFKHEKIHNEQFKFRPTGIMLDMYFHCCFHLLLTYDLIPTVKLYWFILVLLGDIPIHLSMLSEWGVQIKICILLLSTLWPLVLQAKSIIHCSL